jgi:alkyldihydroxyacetonephosphate synthase
MSDVKLMKWWGWGVEGVGFHHEDKPAFRPFLIKIIDLDVNTPSVSPMSLDDLPIPAPLIRDQLLVELIDAVGADDVVQDDLDRIVHTYGKSATDLLRVRAGDIPRVPDVVVYPGNEAEVQLIVDRAVAADAVIIPYGGGAPVSPAAYAPRGRDPASHLT